MEGSRVRARPRCDILLRDNMGETISGATYILRSDTRRTAQTLQHNIGALARADDNGKIIRKRSKDCNHGSEDLEKRWV